MNNVSKLRVKGGFFDELSEISLKTEKSHRVATIYGGNGSGKSSIANAIFEYKMGDLLKEKEFESVSLLEDDSSEITFSSNEIDNIWVYSEKYSDQNIDWNNDNLGAIVMFGEQIEIDSEIQKRVVDLNKMREEQGKIDTSKYEIKKGEYSITSASDAIKAILRKGWAERERKIRNLKTAQLTDNVLNQIYAIDYPSTLSYTKLKTEYEKKEFEFLMVDNSQEKLPMFSFETITKKNIEDLRYLLSLDIPKPHGTVIEEKLLNLILEGKRNLVTDSYRHFTHDQNNECPYCMQTVSNNHKELLIQSIKSVLNEVVEEHQKELNFMKIVLFEINLDLDYLRKYESDAIITFLKNIDSYNEKIQILSDFVASKMENPFEKIFIEDSISELIGELNKQYSELVLFINDFNSRIDSIEESRKYLVDLNKKLARLEINDTYNHWLFLRNSLNSERNKMLDIIKAINDLENEISVLNSKKSNVDIALKDINRNLHQIFSGKNRLSLELDEKSNYRVKSRGKRIKLKKLSTGERNVISLCYFFAHLRNNTNAFSKFSEPYFIVLDDPISSLDFDNKIGIYAFLRKTIGEIIQNNDKSRILVLTHDLDVVYKIEKVFDDVRKSLNIDKFYCGMKLLSNKKTEAVKIKKMNNYAWNIEIIYDYGISKSDEEHINDFYIGNILRKTLEAYSTFNFQRDISGLTQSEEILEKIEDTELKEYFKNRMLRLLLNSESHTEEIANSIVDHDSFEQFSREERIQISKDVLCLLYLLDKEHVKSYLPNDKKKIKNIEKWIDECKFNS